MYLIRRNVIDLSRRKHMLTTLLIVAIAATLVVVPAAVMAVTDPVDDFVIPTPIVNPQTPDEEFFNMRLEFFLPETEPLIKETFGSVLHFEEEAFWEYESYYSRAVSFATNLPTLAKIEYGPTTDYEYSTAQTEFYYYQHLFHLTGLEPGNTYNYRIKVKGSDGAFLTSQNYTFTTPAVPANIVRVPDDLDDKSLPYRLLRSDTKYLLTQDIYAPNGGIILGGYNVVLDLGGHTIVYDKEFNTIVNEFTHPYNEILYNHYATFGIRSSLWNLRNQSIFNGSIIQGENGGSGQFGIGYNPILSTHVAGMEIAGLNVDYYGDSIDGIRVDWNNEIHHNIVYDRGSVVDNRHQQMKAITVAYNPETYTEVSYNSIRRCRQTGIAGSNKSYGNEIYGDSFVSNSFLLGYLTNSRVYSNKVFGLGYHTIGIGGAEMSDALAENNFIYLHAYAPTKRSDEYVWTSSAVGFRCHIYNDNGPSQANNLFENNVIVIKAWQPNIWVRGIQASGSPLVENLQINKNIVKVEVMSDTVDIINQRYPVTCVNFFGRQFQTPDIVLSDNTLQTNATFVCYGYDSMGRDTVFYRTRFEKINHHDSQFWPFRMLDLFGSDLVNNRFFDSIAGPGVDLSLPPTNLNYSAHIWYNLALGVTSRRVYADAVTGAPLANAVILWQLDGTGEQGRFTTDGSGEAYREWITIWNEHKPGEPAQSMTQTFNTTVTFFAQGYAPLTMNIEDTQGTGPPILFGGGGSSGPLFDLNMVAEEPIGAHPGMDAHSARITFWSRAAYDTTEIYRSESPNGPFILARTEYGKTIHGFIDDGLRPNTTYYYKVRLFSGDYAGPLSSVATVKTNELVIEEPLGVRPGMDAYTVNINFCSRSVFDGTEIYRSISPNGPFQLVMKELGKPTFGYNDTTLNPNTTYYYRVRLFWEDHYGPLSGVVAVKTNDLVIEEPLGVRPGLDANTININFWGRSDFDGTEVYRSESPDGPFQLVMKELGKPTFGYDNKGLKPNTTYYYKVRLFRGNYYGPLSGVVSAKTNDLIIEGLWGGPNPYSITLSWWGRSEYSYAEIYRSESPNGDYAIIFNSTAAPYYDGNIVSGTTYYYKVRLIQNGYIGVLSDYIEFTAW